MFNSLKNSPFFELLNHSKNYFISNLATGALAFFSIPIMTRILSPSDYGILAVFMGYQGVFVAVLTLNCYVAMGRYFYEQKDDFKKFFGANLIFVFFLLLVAFFFFLLFQEKASILLSLPVNTIVYIVPAVLIYVAGSWFEQIYIPQKESRKIAIRNVVRALSIFALSVFIILMMDHDKYLGQIIATMIIGLVFFVYYFFDLRPYLAMSFQWKHIRYIIHYSVPLLPYALSGVILAQFDRIMINHYLGSTPAGLYTFAAIIGSTLTILSSALFQAWLPDYFRHMDDKAYDQLSLEANRIFKIIVLAALWLILFGQEIGMVLGTKDYRAALPIIPIVVIGYIFNSIFAFYGWNIQYGKKNIYLSVAVLAAGAVNIVLNIIFIPQFGYFAAAYTTAISYLAMAFLAWLTSKHILKIYCVSPWIMLRPIIIITPLILIYYIISFSDLHFWTFFLIKFLLCIIGGVILARLYIWAIIKNRLLPSKR